MDKNERLQKYFERIGLNIPDNPEPTVDLLAKILFAQIKNIPFSNRDNRDRVATPIDYDSLIDRLVVKKQGGICIDLNGILKFVLEDLGYKVKNHIITHFMEEENIYLRHRFLHVTDIDGIVWRVDSAGIVDPFTIPLKVESGNVQKMHFASFKLEKEGDFWAIYEVNDNETKLLGKYTEDEYPDEYFYQVKLEDLHLDSVLYNGNQESIYTDTGRKTFIGNRYRESDKGEITVSKIIETDEDLTWALAQFGLSK